jgi:TatD DNase family protein
MYIDSHCHLTHNRLLHLGEPEDIVKNADNADVEGMLTISCQIRGDFEGALQLSKKFPNVWCTVGTHPHDAGDEKEQNVTVNQLIEIANSDKKIVGIGETGLDYFYKNSPIEDQQVSFRKHLQACIETELPVVIHARDADEDIIKILEEEGRGTSLTGVMHCFSSSREMGERALELGFYISFSGIVTFKKSTELQEFAKDVPLDRILIETDSPFLAPEPFRGKINEPALVIHTAKFISDLKSISEETIASHSKQNFFNLFTKAKDTE